MEVEDAGQGSGKNLKLNEMLYRKLAAQKQEIKAKEERKAAEDEQKRKADEEAEAKAKAEKEATISKATKEKAKAAEEKSKKKTTKMRIKEAKGVKLTKVSETEDNEENAKNDVQQNANDTPQSKKEFLAKLKDMKKATKEEVRKQAHNKENAEETNDTEENASDNEKKAYEEIEKRKAALIVELKAIEKRAEKQAKVAAETEDETDNEDDADQNDDVDEVLTNIETLPFLNTPKRSKKKEDGKGINDSISEKEGKKIKRQKGSEKDEERRRTKSSGVRRGGCFIERSYSDNERLPVDTEEADFMFKIYFVTLFGSKMGTLKNGDRVSTKLLKRISEDVDISDIDWCGYILEEYYGKIIQKFDKISEERSELDNEGNAVYNDKNNNNDDDGALTADANKQNESDNQKEELKKKILIKEKKKVQVKEHKKVEVKEHKDVTVQMDVDNQNEEKVKTKKEKQDKADKVENVQEKQDADTVEKVHEIKDQDNDLTEDEFWNTQTDSQIDKLMSQAEIDIKNKKTPKRKSTNMQQKEQKKASRFLVSPYLNKKTATNGKPEPYEVMIINYLFSIEGSKFDFIFETKEGNATIRDYMKTLAPT
nr:peptidase C48, SUMO/sentrin/Ubl1 [Tanacetum cinerariifolium]